MQEKTYFMNLIFCHSEDLIINTKWLFQFSEFLAKLYVNNK